MSRNPWENNLPPNSGHLQNISDEAVWSLSSCKLEGFGIYQLLDDRNDIYWQSDGPQPHTITIEFQRKTDVSFLLLYLDFKTDESYTPSKLVVQTGTSIIDLNPPTTHNFNEPNGWQVIDLRKDGLTATRTFVILVQILHNHQNGRDTHVRGAKVLGPGRSHLDADKRAILHNKKTLNSIFDEKYVESAFSGILR